MTIQKADWVEITRTFNSGITKRWQGVVLDASSQAISIYTTDDEQHSFLLADGFACSTTITPISKPTHVGDLLQRCPACNGTGDDPDMEDDLRLLRKVGDPLGFKRALCEDCNGMGVVIQ